MGAPLQPSRWPWCQGTRYQPWAHRLSASQPLVPSSTGFPPWCSVCSALGWSGHRIQNQLEKEKKGIAFRVLFREYWLYTYPQVSISASLPISPKLESHNCHFHAQLLAYSLFNLKEKEEQHNKYHPGLLSILKPKGLDIKVQAAHLALITCSNSSFVLKTILISQNLAGRSLLYFLGMSLRLNL